MSRYRRAVAQTFPLLVLLLLWQFAAWFMPESAFFFASPLAIVKTAAAMVGLDLEVARALVANKDVAWSGGQGLLWNMAVTVGEAIACFIIGLVCGGLNRHPSFVVDEGGDLLDFVALRVIPVLCHIAAEV